MQNLNFQDLKNMLEGGCKKVKSHEDVINSLNVFPVPDSDTGSNLCRTLAPLEDILKNTDGSLEDFEKKILDTALLSSQGNSGIMFVSFLHGFLDAFKSEDITLMHFATGARNGLTKAKESIQNPVAGTILDVMEALTETLEKETGSISDAFLASSDSVTQALKDTTSHLALLADYNVVDAGAFGFALFIYGMYEEISGKEYPIPSFIHSADMSKDTITKNVYEIVSVLHSCQLSVSEIRDLISSFGDCLDILEIDEKVKIHIHTDMVDAVKQSLPIIGTIESVIISDMRTNTVIESI